MVRHRAAPLFYWAISLAGIAFAALVTGNMLGAQAGAPAMAWYDWLGLALILGWGGFLAFPLARIPMTRLTLGADGSVRLATRTLFAARETRLEPGAVGRVELRRNHFGPVQGWQVILHWREGGRLIVNERADGAAQSALAEEIACRLGVGQDR